MKKLMFFVVVALTWVACGNKAQDGAADADSTQVFEVPDTLNTVEAVVRQVDAVYDYLDYMRQHYKEGMPSLDERFATREWQQALADVRAVDKDCECGGFFDFGDEGPLDAWTFDCYEGRVSADSVSVKLLPNGTADVRFLVKDAVTIGGVPMRWLMRVEDGQWRVADIFFESMQGMDLLAEMKRYARYMAFEKTFDINKYVEVMESEAYVIFSKGADDIRLVGYTFVDVDGDGHPEVWVKGDEGQDFQGVYSVVGDSVRLLACSDARSEIDFYKGAVGFSGYYGTGEDRKAFTIVKNSLPGDEYFMEHKFNIFSEEQETVHLAQTKNGETISDEAWNEAEKMLGDTVSVTPHWRPIERKLKLADYAE